MKQGQGPPYRMRVAGAVDTYSVRTAAGYFYAAAGQFAMSTAHDATVKIQSTFSLIHEARIQTSRDSYKMLQGQKFDPGKRTFVIKRAGHKYKENSRCSMSGASCPSNKPLVCTDLETSAKKFGNLFCSMLLPIHSIYKQYIHMYMYTCSIAYKPADGLPQARRLHSSNRPLSLS